MKNSSKNVRRASVGIFPLIGAGFNGSSYQQPRRGLGAQLLSGRKPGKEEFICCS
jgi:hypothetical protein